MGFEQIKVELLSSWGGDRNAAEAAWASTSNKENLSQRSDEDVTRVVTGLVHLHHDTPKERLWMEFFITCPIFIERQFDKYRMTVQYQQFDLSWFEAPMGRDNITQNELSGRYRTIPDRPYTTPRDVDIILDKAIDTDLPEEYSDITPAGEVDALLETQHNAYYEYLTKLKTAEKAGKITNAEYKRAREVLRGVLGTSYLTDMRIVMNMNAFEHIVNQRLAKDAQMESRVVAAKMIRELEKAEVCKTMLSTMISTNGWDKLLEEVEHS